MDLTEIIRNITGLSTPQPAMGGAAPQPQAGVRTPDPASMPPAMGAPPPAAQPPAGAAPGTGATPPDLSALYTKLLADQRRDKYIDSGATLIAAGFARPENRSALINMANGGGGGSGTNASTTLQTLLSLQKDQQAKALRLQQQARLPAIAKKYGLDMDTVNMLFESGKLDETLNTMVQPDNVIETRADGSKYLVNKKTGQRVGGDLEGPNSERNLTTDLKELDRVNSERQARGEAAIPAETWLTQSQTNKANKTNVTIGEKLSVKAGENRLKALDEHANAVQAGVNTIEALNNARDTLDKGIIAGNIAAPAAVEARKLWASAFGLNDRAADNTDAFIAQMKSVVLPRVKALGTGNSISNADVKFVEQATAATNTMTPEALREIMRIIEKGERTLASKYHAEVDEFGKIDEDSAKAAKYARRIKLPAPRLKQATIDAFKNDMKAGDEAGKKRTIADFDEAFGTGAHSYFMD